MELHWKLFLLPFIINIVLSVMRRKRYGYGLWQSVILAVLLLPYGYLAAKLLFIIENPDCTPITWGGLSFYGTVLFVPLLQLITAKAAKLDYASLMDFTAPYGALCLCVVRIGCYVGGCCGAVRIAVGDTEIIPPIQLIESALDLLLFAFLMYRERHNKILIKGEQTCIFTIIYGFIRLIMENYRDTLKNLLGMSNGQWMAIATTVIAFVVLIALHGKLAKTARSEKAEELTEADDVIIQAENE